MRVPENWERIDALSTKDFSVYAGANDWESTWSAVAFVFGDRGGLGQSHHTKRVWGHIRMSDEEGEGDEFTDRGKDVVKKWLKLAKAKKSDGGWREKHLLDAAKELGDQLSGYGLETVDWKPAKIAEALIGGHSETGVHPEEVSRLKNKLDYHRHSLRDPFGAIRNNPAERAVRNLEQAHDASAQSFEGVPTEAEYEREMAIRNFKRQPQMFHNSVTMSRNRNIRRKSFGYPDYRYSLRDRGWPTGQRRRKRAEQLVGQMLDQGAGI